MVGQLGMSAWFVANTGELKTGEVQSKSVSVKFWWQVDLRAKQREIWRDRSFKWCNCKLINFMGQATMAKHTIHGRKSMKRGFCSDINRSTMRTLLQYDSTERCVRGFTDPARQWRWMTFSKPTWNANGHKRLESCKGGWYYDVCFDILCG